MSGAFHEYKDEQDLIRDFRQHWSNPENQRTLPNYIFHSLLDDAILSVVSEEHYQQKSGSHFAVEGVKDNRV